MYFLFQFTVGFTRIHYYIFLRPYKIFPLRKKIYFPSSQLLYTLLLLIAEQNNLKGTSYHPPPGAHCPNSSSFYLTYPLTNPMWWRRERYFSEIILFFGQGGVRREGSPDVDPFSTKRCFFFFLLTS